MAYSAAWVAICEDPFGEAMRARISVRLNDGAEGTPSTLVQVAGSLDILELTPISFKREVEFGVMQGQAWQARIQNADLALLAFDLVDCWVAIEAGFPEADLWELAAQGRIQRVVTATDASVTIEVHDVVMDILNTELARDLRVQGSGWASEVYSHIVGSGSDPYDNQAIGAGVAVLSSSDVADETFRIVFTAPPAFDVLWEDGTTAASGTTAADLDIASSADPLTDVVRLHREGWTGTYAVGDEYVFYTSQGRAFSERLPVVLLQELIATAAGARAYDVLAGEYYGLPWYDDANWTAISAQYDDEAISGTWRKGAAVSELIQDILKLIHGSLFAARTGQIALWALQPSTAVAADLNGNPGNGRINILSGTMTDDLQYACTSVAYEYRDLSGNDAVFEPTVSEVKLQAERRKTVRLGWECAGPLIQPAANKYLSRFNAPRRVFVLETSLAGAVVSVTDGITVTEATFGVALERVDVTEVELHILENRARITGYFDPVAAGQYARVDEATVGGPAVVW